MRGVKHRLHVGQSWRLEDWSSLAPAPHAPVTWCNIHLRTHQILTVLFITRLENARLSIGQLVWRLSHVQGPARMRSSERPTSEGCGETLTGFREEGEQDEGKVRGR